MASAWYSQGMVDAIELRETETGFEMRHHYTLTKSQKRLAETLDSDVGQTSGTLNYWVGSRQIVRLFTSRKFLCVQDAAVPESIPGDYEIRTQIWEHFTTWEPAPDLGS